MTQEMRENLSKRVSSEKMNMHGTKKEEFNIKIHFPISVVEGELRREPPSR